MTATPRTGTVDGGGSNPTTGTGPAVQTSPAAGPAVRTNPAAGPAVRTAGSSPVAGGGSAGGSGATGNRQQQRGGATGNRQQQRSRSTQRRLLEAAVDCLVEQGWAGTTTTLVADRAGVSRGAQLHHYPTKSALLIAAVEHLAERRSAELRTEAAALPPDGDRVDATIRLLASLFTGPLFSAAIEVWVAARTDPALRTALVPVEARFGREVHRLTVELLGADESRPGVREAVQTTLDLMRGLGVASLLTDDSARRTRLLADWTTHLAGVLR